MRRGKGKDKGPSSSDTRQFKPKDFVFVLFEEGIYPSEVITINGDNIEINCLHPFINSGKQNLRYWKWPSSVDKQVVNRLSILPIRPSLYVASQYSHRRIVVYELNNYKLVQNLNSTVLCLFLVYSYLSWNYMISIAYF